MHRLCVSVSKKRNINIYGLTSGIRCECNFKKSNLAGMVEEILLDPHYAGFLKSALALSDDYEKGLLKDLTGYRLWCKMMAEEIAGKKIDKMRELVAVDDMPLALKMALNALLNGVVQSKALLETK